MTHWQSFGTFEVITIRRLVLSSVIVVVEIRDSLKCFEVFSPTLSIIFHSFLSPPSPLSVSVSWRCSLLAPPGKYRCDCSSLDISLRGISNIEDSFRSTVSLLTGSWPFYYIGNSLLTWLTEFPLKFYLSLEWKKNLEMNIFDDNHLSNSTLNSSQCQDFIEIRNKVKSDAKNLRQKHWGYKTFQTPCYSRTEFLSLTS